MMVTSTLNSLAKMTLLAVCTATLACGDGGTDESDQVNPAADAGANSWQNTSDVSGPVAICQYENPFSKAAECREYFGNWSSAQLTQNCGQVFTGVAGALTMNGRCATSELVGACTTPLDQNGLWFQVLHYGGDLNALAGACASNLSGEWKPNGTPETTTPQPETQPKPSTPGDNSSSLNALDEALKSMKSNDKVKVSPECVDETCLQPLVEANQGIAFSPLASSPTEAFIIYPGALVDPRAYAPVAQQIALEGYLVVIVPMPGNFAIGGWERANNIMAAYPAITSWYLGGHSMGGAMAVRYVGKYPAKMKGLILWAAYAGGGDNINASNLPIVSIYGGLDGVATVQEIEAGKALLPASTNYVLLPGANHAQFGLYGEQDGDFKADITPAEQHQQVSATTVHFMRTVVNGTLPSINLFQNSNNGQWCAEAQKIVVDANQNWSDVTLNVGGHDSTESFSESMPGLGAVVQKSVDVQVMLRYQGNASFLGAPSLLAREVWCKMKSSQSVAAKLAFNTSGGTKSCANVNEAVVEWALGQVGQEIKAKYLANAPKVTFQADKEFQTADEWLQSGQLEVVTQSADNSVAITSASLKVGNATDLPEPDRNLVFCKLMAPDEALRWVLTVAQ